jgi:hypothetical protein
MSVSTLTRPAAPPKGRFRLQLRRHLDGQHRWYLFNAEGTPVMNGAGFPTEREARSDAEHFKQELAETQVCR